MLEIALKEADRAEKSRQLRWQHQQIALGNCRICGKPRDPKSKSLCAAHKKAAADRAAGRVASQQQAPQTTE